jgi:hypothetical protein
MLQHKDIMTDLGHEYADLMFAGYSNIQVQDIMREKVRNSFDDLIWDVVDNTEDLDFEDYLYDVMVEVEELGHYYYMTEEAGV